MLTNSNVITPRYWSSCIKTSNVRGNKCSESRIPPNHHGFSSNPSPNRPIFNVWLHKLQWEIFLVWWTVDNMLYYSMKSSNLRHSKSVFELHSRGILRSLRGDPSNLVPVGVWESVRFDRHCGYKSESLILKVVLRWSTVSPIMASHAITIPL